MDTGQYIHEEILSIRREHLYRELRSSSKLSFIHNDYLGLSQHPSLIQVGREALSRYGAGSRGSRLLGGHCDLFSELECEIAQFFGAPSALFFSSGYLANLAVIHVLASHFERILSDKFNHASLIDAIRLTNTTRQIVPHGGWKSLSPPESNFLMVCESLFSMEGDTADLAALQKLLKTGRAFLVLDEAHAGGIFTASGRGLSEAIHAWEQMAVTVTFGKAFGVGGAAVLCSTNLRDLLINRARSFIYTTAPPPAVAAMVRESLAVMRREGESLRRELWRRALEVRERLNITATVDDEGLRYWAERSPIVPLFIPGEERALRFSENMRELGFDVRAIRYPTVPLGSERVRISLNLDVSWKETELMVEGVEKLWRAYL